MLMSSLEFVDAATARDARGLRLVVALGVASPWSLAARAILELKQLPALVVRAIGRDDVVQSWSGIRSWNVPIAIYEQELPRTGWAEILALAERLAPDRPLVPTAHEARALHHGLSHELMGEGGVLWSARSLAIDASLTSEGASGFPLPTAKYLGARYGHTAGASTAARARISEGLELVAKQLERSRGDGHRYVLGDQLTALDIYVATALMMLAPLGLEQCPDHRARGAFLWIHSQIADLIPSSLLAHRDLVYSDHIGLPVVF
jgi:glutathione S-transferase